MKNKRQKFVTALSAILLGVISSGLWELVFSPLSHMLISQIIIVPAKVSSLIGNWYVSQIASADRDYLSISIRSFIFAIIFLLVSGIDWKRILSSMPYFLRIFLIFTLAIDMLIDIQISNTSHFISQNIEIVAPYIDEQHYKQLKSDFYTMDSMEDFNDLNQKLKNIADKHSLHLH